MNGTIKTTLYLALLTGLLLSIGNFISGTSGLITAFILAALMNFGMYFFSDKIALAMHRAREVSEDEAPNLHAIVKKLSEKAKIPKPKVYFINMPVMNAFATGRSPKHAAVAVTPLLLQNLTNEEVEAVLGHELTHIKNRDTLISAISATIAGAITMISRMFWYTGFGRRDDEQGDALSFIVMIFIVPIIALLVRLAISRVREFAADKGGAELSSREAMISALQALHFGPKIRVDAAPATSHMFIVNPFKGSSLFELLSTHPPIEKRIERLQKEL